MRVRVVAYMPDDLSRDVSARIARHLSLERSQIRSSRYAGVLGGFRMWHDGSRGTLPEIEVAPQLGPVDALILGAPLVAGGLAAPMRAFIARPHRIPPVLGVFATCERRWPATGFEADLDRLSTGAGAPEALILSRCDMDAAAGRMPRALRDFLDRLAPKIRIPPAPLAAGLPIRAA